MTVAFHYTCTKPPKSAHHTVFGLHVAVGELVKAYCRFSKAEKIPFLIGTQDEWNEVQSFAAKAGVDPTRLVPLDRRFPENTLNGIGTVFRAEPDTRNLLWQRQHKGTFAFCGLAHAISGTEAGDVLQEYCLAPSERTDAIICPSHAVKEAIAAFWDSYAEYLNQRFNTTYRCPVQLPVIPLGLDVDKFAPNPDKRTQNRERLGVTDNDIVLLWVGRLSAAIKAHPLAMFDAAQKAAQQTTQKIHLVMMGYFVPENAKPLFESLAAEACPDVFVHFIASNDPRFPDGLWNAGDIFLSLIDNFQESFGLTPIEAMAAGLPRVISNWDGYRDSVDDGVDGFLIDTMQPPPGNGFDLTAQILSGREVYGGFLAKAALTVAVDTDQAAEKLVLLIKNKEQRLTMGGKARTKAKAIYEWKHIIPAYEALWDNLGTTRATNAPPTPRKHASAYPLLPDPYTMYRTYPSATLSENTRLYLSLAHDTIARLLKNPLNTYAFDILVSSQDLSSLLLWLGKNKDASIDSILATFPALDRPALWRTLAWLLKLGIVKKSSCQASVVR